MAKINVYSSSASNAIKVFDANSTGVKPDNAILVTTGTEPSNAIQINVGEKKWSSIAVNFGGESPTPPGPTWETVTIGDNVWMAENLKYDDGGNGIYKADNVTVNGVDFGEQYYYSRDAVKRISGNFPGWHISTREDCELLKNQVEDNSNSLRSTSGWYNGKNGNNLYGFSADPVGYFDVQAGNVAVSQGRNSYITSLDVDTIESNDTLLVLSYNNSMSITTTNFRRLYPIRLVKDSE